HGLGVGKTAEHLVVAAHDVEAGSVQGLDALVLVTARIDVRDAHGRGAIAVGVDERPRVSGSACRVGGAPQPGEGIVARIGLRGAGYAESDRRKPARTAPALENPHRAVAAPWLATGR